MKTPRQWYRSEVTDDASVAEIHIIDVIGDWVDERINEYYGVTATVTAKAFIKQLAELPSSVTTIRVHINSPGGDVFAAICGLVSALGLLDAAARRVLGPRRPKTSDRGR